MAKRYSFPAQPASESCPTVPKSVSVWGESLFDATKKLAEALKKDSKLEQEHPEFNEQEQKPAKNRK